jgi:hypothetical protein
MRFLGITILALVVALIGLYLMGRYVTKPTRPATDFALDQTTPQGTLRMFLAAVATKDLDAMVAVKDFDYEAGQILAGKGPGIENDSDLVAKTAEVLELAFRTEWQQRAWPELSGAVSHYSDASHLDWTTVRLTEVIQYPSGVQERTVVKLVRRGSKWRLVHSP